MKRFFILALIIILFMGGYKMSEKVYGICENKCLKEVTSAEETIVKGDFAVLTGQLDQGVANIEYPNGFNKDNCVVISLHMQRNDTPGNGWGTGTTMDSSSYVAAALPARVQLKDTIQIRTKNILLSDEDNPKVLDSTVSNYYKLVIMKVY